MDCLHNTDVRSCKLCVPPIGRPDSKICIIGARPGPEELREREPFVGWSGILLFRLLEVPRESCYITNVRKDFSRTHSVPTMEEIHEVLPQLRSEIDSTRANIYITLGTQALYSLTKKTSIDLWRGSIIESTLCPPRKCAATWHPATANRVYSHRYVIARDLRRFKREAEYPDIRRPIRTFILDPSMGTAMEFLRSLGDSITVDIETLDGRRCICLCDDPSRALCIPINGGSLNNHELLLVLREVDNVLRTRGIGGQNIQFDVSKLEEWGFAIGRIDFDTMLAHHLLWTELGRPVVRKGSSEKGGIDDLTGKHSLDFITSIYCDNLPYYKDESNQAWEDPSLVLSERWTKYWGYNCKDGVGTEEAKRGLKAELIKYHQWEYYQEHVLGLIRPVMAMQQAGLEVDQQALSQVRTRATLERDYLQAKLNNAIGFACNVRSTTDMRYLIYEKLKYQVKNLTKKRGAPSADKDTILEYSYNSPDAELFTLILNIRKRRTLVSSFLDLQLDPDGRYRAYYLLHGADSGRLSSRSKGRGPQLQNVPKYARRIFRAKQGFRLVSGDYKRAEAMYVAYDAGDPFLTELFKDPRKDLYLSVAAKALGTNEEEARPYRDCFKHVVLASNYLLGPRKLIIVLRIVPETPIYIEDIPVRGITNSVKKAEYLLGLYHESAKHVKRWQKRVIDEVSKTRTLYDSHGRRRMFLGRLDKHTFGTACSYRPQASVVGNTNKSLRLLYSKGIIPVAQTHDELLLEVPKSEVTESSKMLKQIMEFPIPVFDGRTVTIPVEIKVGKNWGEMEVLAEHEGKTEVPRDYTGRAIAE